LFCTTSADASLDELISRRIGLDELNDVVASEDSGASPDR
jgi:hypothetical protein